MRTISKELEKLMKTWLIDTITILQLKSHSNPNQKHFLYVRQELEKEIIGLTGQFKKFSREEMQAGYDYITKSISVPDQMELSYLRFLSFQEEYINKFGRNY